MYTEKKLKSLPYGNAKIRVYENGDMDLISYTTPVILIRNGWLECTGLYSRTTINHIGKFMREYGFGDYYTAKRLYKQSKKINIKTGQTLPVV